MFFKYNEIQYLGWKKSRQKGAKAFIVFNGMLGFGLVFFVLMAGNDFFSGAISLDTIQVYLLPRLLQSMLTGALWGLLMWQYNEYQYKKYEKSKDIDI